MTSSSNASAWAGGNPRQRSKSTGEFGHLALESQLRDADEEEDSDDGGAASLQMKVKSLLFGRQDAMGLSASERIKQSRLARQAKYKESLATRNTVLKIMDEEDGVDAKDRALAPGEDALVRDKACMEYVSRTGMHSSGAGGGGLKSGGQLVTPIAKNLERVKTRAAEREEKAKLKAETTNLERANRLYEWFDAGFKRMPDILGGGLAGKKPLPAGYQTAPWASDEIPLAFHKSTVTVVWPTRLDLMPFFQEMERAQVGRTVSKIATTVYYYTSHTGMRNIIRASDLVEDCTVQEPHEWGEEIWDRVEQDMDSRNLVVEEAPAFSLPFVASEPTRFETKDGVLKAVYRTEKPTQAPTTVGYCIAFSVPMDQCIAVAGRLSAHTVVVMPPGQDNLSDLGSMGSGQEKKKIISWSMRANLKRLQEKNNAVIKQVEQLGLLSGLIDRETGKQLIVADTKEKSADIATEKERIMAKHRGKNVMDAMDDVEEMLTNKHAELVDRQVQIRRKLRQAEKYMKKKEEGEDVPLLLVDASRIKKLREHLVKVNKDVKAVEDELVHFEEAASSGRSRSPRSQRGEGEDDGGATGRTDGSAKKEKKKKTKKIIAVDKKSEFSSQITGTVLDIGEEYNSLQGDIFRDVFGGNMIGVSMFLKNDGDVNEYHESTGWTPLIMATSAGDPDMVTLLMRALADPRKGSKSEGLTPMHIAVQKNEPNILNTIMMSNDQGIREKAKDGATPLLTAVRRAPAKSKEEFVKILLEGNSDPNAMDLNGWTPLSLAVFKNYRGVVRLLVSNRGNVLEVCPDTEPKLTIWQVAAQFRGLQQLIKTKLSSRDMHLIEKRFPGSLGQKVNRKDDDDDD